MYPVALFGLVTLVLIMVNILVANKHLAHFAVGGLIMTLFTGLLGTSMGLVEAFHASNKAPADQMLIMVLAATTIALHPIILALGATLSHAILGGIMFARTMQGAPQTA